MLIYSGWKRTDIIKKMQSTKNNKLQKWQRQKKSKIKIFILYEISNKNISITMFYCEKYPKTSSVKFSIIMAAFIYKHNPDIFFVKYKLTGLRGKFLRAWDLASPESAGLRGAPFSSAKGCTDLRLKGLKCSRPQI